MNAHATLDMIELGKMLRAARLRAGLTDREITTRLGWSLKSITAIESAHNKISLDRLLQLAGIYNTPVEAFFGRGPEGIELLQLAAYVPDPRRNVIRIEGELAYIRLHPPTTGPLAGCETMEALIDAEDVDRVQDFPGRWTGQWGKSSKHYYVAASVSQSYKHGEKKLSPIKLHRFLLDAPSGLDVDHKNGDTLDNTKGNLRLATRAQNAQNTSRPTSKSGFRGVVHVVTHREKRDYWKAQLSYRDHETGKKQWFHRYFPYTPEGLQMANATAIMARKQYQPFYARDVITPEVEGWYRLAREWTEGKHDRCRGVSGNIKLTHDQVREIRRLAATTTLTYAQLAQPFGVSGKMVGRILRGQAWSHLE